MWMYVGKGLARRNVLSLHDLGRDAIGRVSARLSKSQQVMRREVDLLFGLGNFLVNVNKCTCMLR